MHSVLYYEESNESVCHFITIDHQLLVPFSCCFSVQGKFSFTLSNKIKLLCHVEK